jgi:hypothetical protein
MVPFGTTKVKEKEHSNDDGHLPQGERKKSKVFIFFVGKRG